MSDNDAAVKDEPVNQEPGTTEPAPVEDKTPEVVETSPGSGEYVRKTPEPKAPEEDKGTPPNSKETVPDDTGETPPDGTKPQSQEEQQPTNPRSQNRYQKLANDNREMRTQLDDPEFLSQRLRQIKTQDSQVALEQELLEQINPATQEYYTVEEAQRIARQKTLETSRQQNAQDEYVVQVQQNQSALSSQAHQALTDFPMFDEKSDKYNPELSAKADKIVKDALIWDQDANGNPVLVGSRVNPYDIYQSIAEAAQTSSAAQAAISQRNTERMLANADVPSGAPQAEKPFHKLSTEEMAKKLREKGHDI